MSSRLEKGENKSCALVGMGRSCCWRMGEEAGEVAKSLRWGSTAASASIRRDCGGWAKGPRWFTTGEDATWFRMLLSEGVFRTTARTACICIWVQEEFSVN